MSPPGSAETLVLIPALNEGATVANVVRAARTSLGCDVLVIDDGSHDNTCTAALGAGAMVISHPFNLGVGGAIRTGMRVASDQGRRYVVQLDADGQHEPTEAKRLLDRVVIDGADMAVGSAVRLRVPGVAHPAPHDAAAEPDGVPAHRDGDRRHHQRVPGLRSAGRRGVRPRLPDRVPVGHRRGPADRRRRRGSRSWWSRCRCTRGRAASRPQGGPAAWCASCDCGS